jgi:hypothetical protein
MLKPLKRAIVQADPVHFSLISGRGSLGSRNGDTLTFHEPPLHIPVDINVSSGLPSRGHISDIDEIPLVPYYFLILQKLEKWDISAQQGHLPQGESINLSKEIRAMLRLLRLRKFHCPQPPFDVRLHNSSKERVLRFFALHHCFKNEWQEMGFSKQIEAGQRTPKKPKRAASEQSAAGPSRNSASQTIPTGSGASSQIKGESVQHTQNNFAPFMAVGVITQDDWHAGGLGKTAAAAKKPKSKGPRISFTQIRHMAAHVTVRVLHELGYSCAIFGSYACKLYGNNRIPNVGPF